MSDVEGKPDLGLVLCMEMVTLRRVGEGHWLLRRSLEEPGSLTKVQPTVLCEQVLWLCLWAPLPPCGVNAHCLRSPAVTAACS